MYETYLSNAYYSVNGLLFSLSSCLLVLPEQNITNRYSVQTLFLMPAYFLILKHLFHYGIPYNYIKECPCSN